MAALHRIASDVGIGKQPLLLRLVLAPRQPEDDAMDMSAPARVAQPFERAVGEGDFQIVALEQERPQLRDLLALRDRIGGDEGDAWRGRPASLPLEGRGNVVAAPRVVARLEEPSADIIERPARAAEPGDTAHLRALMIALELRAAERRIAEHE